MQRDNFRRDVLITKSDTDLQIVYAEVYVPGFPDAHGEFMIAEEIRKMAHSFLKEGKVFEVDTEHDGVANGSYVVESFIARPGDPDFIEGAWVVGVQIVDPLIWQQILDGDINGFSMEAIVSKVPTVMTMDIPEFVKGGTEEALGHSHSFKVFFDEEGNFCGGRTLESDGHYHDILRGTVTEDADGHNHRFSFVELVL